MTSNLRAILLMVFAMFCFSLCDLFVKLASRNVPTGQVIAIMGAGEALIFYGLMRVKGQSLWVATYAHWSVLMRTLGEILAGVAMVISLTFIPLAIVTAVLQSQPLVLTAAGALFLKEKVGARRVAAILIGFVGVLLIVRPFGAGPDSMSVYGFAMLLAVLGMTIRDVGARLVPSFIPTLAIACFGAMAVFVVGAGMMALSLQLVIPKGGAVWGYLVAMIISGAGGVFFVTAAMRLGELSAVSPFRYAKIIFGMGAGIFLLGEHLDSLSILGTVIIVCSGLYALWRERTIAQSSPS